MTSDLKPQNRRRLSAQHFTENRVSAASNRASSMAEPPKLLDPHAPVLVSKTSNGYACAPDNLTGSVRVPQGPRINDEQPRSRD
jgi:hypothetical protein